jgi:transcriptional regulator with XRE-family HTH domain
MSQAAKRKTVEEAEPVRVLGRGLRAARGVRMTPRTVREAAGKTQVEVGRATGMDQADVSRLENRVDFSDCQVATLERYVQALGGELELVARFGDKRIALVGAQPAEAKAAPANKALQRTGRKTSHR